MFAKAAVVAAIVGAVGMASAQPAPVISGRTAAYVCPTSNTAGLALTAQVAATADVGTVAAADAFVCLYIGANAAALGLPLVGNSPLVPGGLTLGGVVNAAATVNACIYSKLTGALIGLGVQADANLCPVQASILVNKRRRHAIDRTSSFEHLD